MKLTIQILFLTLLVTAVDGQEYIISTVAGGAPPPTPIAATQASIGGPAGVAVDSAGNIYFAALHCVFKVDASGVMTRVAGNSRPGYSGDGGPATNAQLNGPGRVAVDTSGNLYIADWGNARIRKVTIQGIITTVAGIGIRGYSGDGGPATSAPLWDPSGVTVDTRGNLYIADANNVRIRKVTTDGIITTVAGNGDHSSGYSGDGGPATSAHIGAPGDVTVDTSGNIYFTSSNRIRKVAADGIITTVAGNGVPGYSGDGGPATSAQFTAPNGLSADTFGNLYIIDGNRIRKVGTNGIITTVAGRDVSLHSGDGGPATSATLGGPLGVTVDTNGNLYIAETSSKRIRKVATDGIITTVAGNGLSSYSGDRGPATTAQLDTPRGVAVDSSGNLYIADSFNSRVRKVTTNGIITTFAGNGAHGSSGDSGLATSAQLWEPRGLATDIGGNLYIADSSNFRVRKVTTDGTITTVAGSSIGGYSGDGGPATRAQLAATSGVTVDISGNLYFADTGNHRIRKVAPDGIITTVAGNGVSGYSGDGGPATNAQLDNPSSVAVDTTGNLYIADWFNSRIRKVTTEGIITTVAGNGMNRYSGDGGPATSAQIGNPFGVAVDTSGNLYIADGGNARIRKVAANGIITTVAGNGMNGYSGDGGPATSAQLSNPFGVAVDTSGNLYVADTGNNAIRRLTPSTSTCGYSLSSASLQAPVAGGSSLIRMTSGAGCAWSVSNLPDWITVSGLASGSGSATVTLLVAPNSGPPRSAQISVAGIAVTVTQASSILSVSPGGVVSAASYTSPVAPGSIAAIFGNFLLPAPQGVLSFPIPTSLGGLSIRFSGAPLSPLFYANVGQVNAQVPWELAGQSQATVTVTLGGQTSAPQTASLAAYAPAIFSISGEGLGQGAILDAGYRLVDLTNPAIPGSTVVQIYCTGLGRVTNQPATGAPAPGSPLAETTIRPAVMIGGIPAQVQFSGLTPGFVGLYQVNALVPPDAPRGRAVPVAIIIGGTQSNAVSIAVQ